MHWRKRAQSVTKLFAWLLLLAFPFLPVTGSSAEFSFLLMSHGNSDASVVISSQVVTNRGQQEGNRRPFLVGEVVNRGEKKVRQVRVIYQVFDVAGNEVARGHLKVVPEEIPPKGVGQFWGHLSGIGEESGLTVNTKVEWSL